MSLSAACIVVRDLLRTGLTSFYDTDALKAASCKIQPDDRPDPRAGEEFIAIRGSEWSPHHSDDDLGGDGHFVHEIITVQVALTRRLGITPWDRAGEVTYIKDEDIYISQYKSMEQRIREIIKLIHRDYLGQQAAFAAELASGVETYQLPYAKLSWIGGDAEPIIVGASHFHAEGTEPPPSGLMMRVRFRGSPTIHVMETFGEVSET